jgi:hypothetical protein
MFFSVVVVALFNVVTALLFEDDDDGTEDDDALHVVVIFSHNAFANFASSFVLTHTAHDVTRCEGHFCTDSIAYCNSGLNRSNCATSLFLLFSPFVSFSFCVSFLSSRSDDASARMIALMIVFVRAEVVGEL